MALSAAALESSVETRMAALQAEVQALAASSVRGDQWVAELEHIRQQDKDIQMFVEVLKEVRTHSLTYTLSICTKHLALSTKHEALSTKH
jgi:hypothetical protein